MDRILILIATHYKWLGVKRLYRNLSKGMPAGADLYLLEDVTHYTHEGSAYDLPAFTFNESLLKEVPYPRIRETLLPGQNLFPLLKVALEHPEYEYVWYIEYDVYFSGSWKVFFDATKDLDVDLLSAHMQRYANANRSWHWWELTHPSQEIALTDRVKSFNPVYRLSRRAVNVLDRELRSGWQGHHEVLMPTLLSKNGCKIADFGGGGKFTPDKLKGKFYGGAKQAYSISQTFRWRPLQIGFFWWPHKLYHPVKPFRTRYSWYREHLRWKLKKIFSRSKK